MRHRNRGRRLNRNAAQRRALMRGLARALILSKTGRIITTTGKAKEARPFVEKLVTLARAGDETSRRRAIALLGEHRPSERRAKGADAKGASKWFRIPPKPRDAVDRKAWRKHGLPKLPAENPVVAIDRLFGEIGLKFKDRPGGYTRILKLGEHRMGDNAEQVLLEFVESIGEASPSPETGAEKAAKRPAEDKKETAA
jgi:large subunit ribosomal protein L17